MPVDDNDPLTERCYHKQDRHGHSNGHDYVSGDHKMAAPQHFLL